jgi:hypothetical protein
MESIVFDGANRCLTIELFWVKECADFLSIILGALQGFS